MLKIGVTLLTDLVSYSYGYSYTGIAMLYFVIRIAEAV